MLEELNGFKKELQTISRKVASARTDKIFAYLRAGMKGEALIGNDNYIVCFDDVLRDIDEDLQKDDIVMITNYFTNLEFEVFAEVDEIKISWEK